MGTSMEGVKTTWGTVYYRINSGTANPSLFFIHGAGADSMVFQPQLNHFKDRKALAADLPGHGRSVGAVPATLGDYAECVLAIARAECVDRFIPVGHSMGGGVCMELYRQAPEMIAGMVLISTGPYLPVAKVVFDLIEKDYEAFCAFLVKFSLSREASAEMRDLTLGTLRAIGAKVVENNFRICGAFDYREILPSVSVPVLILSNRSDKMVPPEIAEELHGGIEGSRHIVYDFDGHMPFLDLAGRVNADIETFLRDHFPSPEGG